MRKELRNRCVVLLSIAFLFCLPHLQGAYSDRSTSVNLDPSTIEWVSLSGYVNDTAMNPISGAIITVTCGDESYGNTSDPMGYYYVGPLPLAYCLWTISFSKEGYRTFSVEMPIVENLTYNVILTAKTTIFVDDTPGEGPDNPAENFTSIQDAIDAADDGDTIFVYEGVYYENIIVNKSLNLYGENKEFTIIVGKDIDSVVTLYDTINISGFTIKDDNNCSLNAGILVLGNGSCVENNDIRPDIIGIHLGDAQYNIIRENELFCESWGMDLCRASNNTIEYNQINSGSGIAISGLYSNNNVLKNNVFNNKGTSIWLLEHARNNIISFNIISNSSCGIYVGEFFQRSIYNVISFNTFIGNDHGIIFRSTSYNKIYNNYFIKSNQSAISIRDSHYNTILNNTILENNQIGLELIWESNYNLINHNLFTKNQDYGIYLSRSSENSINYNNLILNSRNAYFENCTNSWNNNYWDRYRLLPKLIFGEINSKIRFNVDWHPAKEPYDIWDDWQ